MKHNLLLGLNYLRTFLLAQFICFWMVMGCNGVEAAATARVDLGIEFFSSFLAADANIGGKTDKNNQLVVVILHNGNETMAQKLALLMRQVQNIRGFPLRVVLTNDPTLTNFNNFTPAGIFLSQPRPDDLEQVIAWGRQHHRLVLSPFPGDVERGILGGISVREVVLPKVNMTALQEWKVSLKPFFLRIARRYDHE
ncbi:MAG: hypothetical protein HQL68_08825 [Magnetococcales bacterium]|nr:hypothetical protein [Magnetococcales bacterium]